MNVWLCVCVCVENSAFVQHFTVFLFVDITFAYIAQYLRVFHVSPASAGIHENLVAHTDFH